MAACLILCASVSARLLSLLAFFSEPEDEEEKEVDWVVEVIVSGVSVDVVEENEGVWWSVGDGEGLGEVIWM